MQSLPYLLVRGNGKLGENIYQFSIPAVETCPGRSAVCERHCYARTGHYVMGTVQSVLQRNLDASKEDGFACRMVREIQRRWCRVVRVHVSGDFYSPEYTEKWFAIATRCPETTFYAYTRSWRVPEVVGLLEQLAKLDNFRLWYSGDEDTGMPPDVPEGVRVAWMLATDEDEFETVDLVFRVRRLRTEPAKRIGLSLVCPTENGSDTDTDCGTCGHCWR